MHHLVLDSVNRPALKQNTVSAFYLTQFRGPITKRKTDQELRQCCHTPVRPRSAQLQEKRKKKTAVPNIANRLKRYIKEEKTVAHFWVKFVSAIFLAKTILCAGFFCVITFTVSSCNGKWRGLVWRMETREKH